MRKLWTMCGIALLTGVLLTGCGEKKAEKSEAEIQEMIDKAAEKKVAELEEKRAMQEKLDRAEAIIAADEAKKAQEKAADEAKKAQTKTAPAAPQRTVTKDPVVAIPGTHYAHVIREGGYTNARMGPGTDYPISQKVKDGSPILYSGTLVRNGWVEVYTTDGVYLGYMSANKIVR